MHEWHKAVEEKPIADQWEFRSGPFFVVVDDQQDQRWEYLSCSLGQFNAKSLEDCLETWPRRAIAQLRAALDKFEATLGESQ